MTNLHFETTNHVCMRILPNKPNPHLKTVRFCGFRRVRAAVGVTIPTNPNRIDHIHYPNHADQQADRGTYRGVIGVLSGWSIAPRYVARSLALLRFARMSLGMGDCGPCNDYPDRFTYPTEGWSIAPRYVARSLALLRFVRTAFGEWVITIHARRVRAAVGFITSSTANRINHLR